MGGLFDFPLQVADDPTDPTSIPFNGSQVSLGPAVPSALANTPNFAALQQVATAQPFAQLPFAPLAPTLNLPGISTTNPALGNTPISPNAPRAYTTFENKWRVLTPQLNTIFSTIAPKSNTSQHPAIIKALVQFDSDRVAKGQAPLTMAETFKVIKTALTNTAATPAPEPSPWNIPVNAFHDLTNILASVPRIPAALIKEAADLPHFAEKVAENAAHGDNPIQALAHAPGLRMIPGAYTVANLAGGTEGIREAATHPISTLLDVLPAAHSLELGPKFAATRAGQIAESARTAAADAIRPSPLGQFAQRAFGKLTREASMAAAGVDFEARKAFDPRYAPTDAIDTLAKASAEITQRLETLTADNPVRQTELTRIAEAGLQNLPDEIQSRGYAPLTPDEHAYLDSYRSLGEDIAKHNALNDLVATGDFFGQQEVFSVDKWKAITKARQKLTTYQALVPLAEEIKSFFSPTRATATSTDPAFLRTLLQSPEATALLDSPTIAKQTKVNYLRGVVHVADLHGIELPPGIKQLLSRDPLAARDGLVDLVSPWPLDLPATPHTPTTAQRELARQWQAKYRGYTPKRLDKVTAAETRTTLANAPDRWQPLVQSEYAQRVQKALADRGYLTSTSPNLDSITRYLRDGEFRYFVQDGLVTERELFAWRDEAAQTILDLRAAGHDPIWVHHTRASPGSIVNSRPLSLLHQGTIRTPSQIRARTLDFAPYSENLGVAVTHAAQELVAYRGTYNFLKDVYLNTSPTPDSPYPLFARTRRSLYDQYAAAAEKDFGRVLGESEKSAILKRMEREWQPFPSSSLPAKMREELGLLDEGADIHPWVPRALQKNLESFIKPPEFNAVLDPILNTFRMSLLPFSPRWHVYNILGGAIMVSMRTKNPLAIIKYASEARDLISAINAGDEAAMAASGITRRVAQTLGSSTQPFIEMQHFESGRLLGRLFGESRTGEVVGKFGKAVTRAADASYELNGRFDDFYRMVAFLDGRDAALMRAANNGVPISVADAAAEGERLARKVMVAGDSQTALERSVMRYVFPFYGFMSHILRYAYKYPIDHPFRAAMTAAIARNELDDLGTGLPQTFLNSLFLGEPDENGKVQSLQLSGMNPFRDVANYMTLAGFLSSVNPVFATVLEQLGVDIKTGGAGLYPNISYDATSGRLRGSHPNPITNFLYNLIPQASILTGIMDSGSALQSTIHRNPAAGVRLALSQLGVPVMWREYSVPEEQFKAELARQKTQAAALNDALSSGDYSSAMAFPQLRPMLSQVHFLSQQNALGGFDVTDQLAAFQKAIAARVA